MWTTRGQKGKQGPGCGGAGINFRIGAEAYEIAPYPWNPLLRRTTLLFGPHVAASPIDRRDGNLN